MLKHTQSTIKIILYSILVVSAIIGLAFVSGTFYPNSITVNKLEDQIHKNELKVVEELGLEEPEFEFSDKVTFINATSKCISYLNWTTGRSKRVPISIVIAMAGIESAWGQSRFSKELGNPDATWGVKKYKTKCQSIKDMIRILNTHPAYKKFRTYREDQLARGRWDYRKLLSGMTAWSTNPDYQNIILSTIVDNKLP